MSRHLRFLAAMVLPLLLITPVRAEVLATNQLLTPLIPDASRHMSVPVAVAHDPHQPVWVVYQLVGISAESDPEGEVVVNASFEMVPIPITDSVLIFKASNMKIEKSAGALDERVKAIIGERSPEEMREMLGEEMYGAYLALSKKEGSYVIGNITKTYNVGEPEGLNLLTSVERARGVQPVVLNVIIGQGDIPEQYRNSFLSSLNTEKLIAAIISLLLALFFIFRRK